MRGLISFVLTYLRKRRYQRFVYMQGQVNIERHQFESLMAASGMKYLEEISNDVLCIYDEPQERH
jgi:hypothetical protein